MISKLIKLPILKRLIPSISIRLLKLFNKNRGYFKVNGDTRMFLDFLDPLDREIIIKSGIYEKKEIEFFIKSNNIINNNFEHYFIDVGANCGYYSVLKFAKRNCKT